MGEPGPLSEARPRANKVLALAKTGKNLYIYIKATRATEITRTILHLSLGFDIHKKKSAANLLKK